MVCFIEIGYHTYDQSLWAIRPVSSHLRVVPDFCSWRGMLVLGGNQATPMKFGPQDRNPLAGQSQAGLWFGKTDDLWDFGPLKGMGGVWHQTEVQAGEVSDPYLMYGFNQKTLHLIQNSDQVINFKVEVDIFGNGDFANYEEFTVSPGDYVHHEFPAGYSAYWVRVTVDKPCTATALMIYQ